MENSHVIEPAFRVIGVGPRPQRALFSPAAAVLLAKKVLFALLDHLGICHAPRILGAQCLAAETISAATATSMGE